MTKALHVAPRVAWPLDAVTETFWWTGVRGSGKTHDCTVMVEEMLAAGLQVVVIDPMSAWWGLRSDADGTGPGVSIPIFGGPRGDVPLESGAGGYMADLAMGERVSMILDVKTWSKAEQRRFVTAFLPRLLARNDEPLHLVVEETPVFAPQKPQPGEQAMLGAVEAIVRLGRGSGVGFSAVSQRSAHLNAEVRAQIEVLVAHRTAAPLDRKAIQAWFDVHDPDRVTEAMKRLPFLPTGNAIVSSTEFLGTFAEVGFRRRRTFDSSATPKVGAKARREARTLADVDLAGIQAKMAETIERAKADDPRELRRRIAELERFASSARDDYEKGCSTAHTVGYDEGLVDGLASPREPERVEVPILDAKALTALETLAEHLKRGVAASEGLLPLLETTLGRLDGQQDRGPDVPARGPTSGGAGSRSHGRPPAPDAISRERRARENPVQRGDPPPRRERGGAPVSGAAQGTKLGKAERLVLTALAQYPQGRTKRQVAFLAGYSANGGGFNNPLGRLRTAGLVVGGPDRLQITQDGADALGEWAPLPTGRDLADWWMANAKLGHAEREILRVLLEVWPQSLTKEQVAAATVSSTGDPYNPNGGGFNNPLGRLRTLELVDGLRGDLRASDDLVGS